MSRYSTFHVIEPSLPRGRLAHVGVTLAPQGHMSRITYMHLAGHIAPALLEDLAEMSRHLARSVFFFDRDRLGRRPVWDSWIERVPSDLLLPLVTFTLRKGVCDGRDFYEFRCRDSMITRDLADELNNRVYPSVYGALLPRQVPVRAPVPSGISAV